MAGYYGITLAFRVSVRLSSVRILFSEDNLNKDVSGFSPNSVCALILWRSGLGLLMGKFCQFLTELSAPDTSVFSCPDDNVSKYYWSFTKLGVCMDILETCLGIVDVQILSIYDRVICPRHPYFHFWMITLVNINEFSPNLVCALILWRSALGLLMTYFVYF